MASARLFTIARLNRDIGEYATLGALYTQIGASKVAQTKWAVWMAASASTTAGRRPSKQLPARPLYSTVLLSRGPAYSFNLQRTSRGFSYSGTYYDVSSGFRTDVGFVPRPDVRDFDNFLSYFFWPEGDRLTRWGFELMAARTWDHSGVLLSSAVEPSIEWTFAGPTHLEFNFRKRIEALREQDHPALHRYRDKEYSSRYDRHRVTARVTGIGGVFWGNLRFGDYFNLRPPEGEEPSPADWRELSINLLASGRTRSSETKTATCTPDWLSPDRARRSSRITS